MFFSSFEAQQGVHPGIRPDTASGMPERSLVELRSDTFTLPTPGMKEAMWSAEVGDDVWGEDPSVRALEARAAACLGHSSAVFCPSGTMANQIALAVHLRPGDAVMCADTAHIHLYEGGGGAANSGISTRTLPSDRGRFRAEDVAGALPPDDPHFVRVGLVAVEDTSNQGGGAVWDPGELERLARLCRERGMALHLDGARVMNRLVAVGDDRVAYGRRFDSVSMCLSKGLGAPLGSVLLGSDEFIREARRVRKRWGGAMRQAGYMAAAGLYALEHHVERLLDDHRRARLIEAALLKSPRVAAVLPVETNIILFRVHDLSVKRALEHFETQGIRAAGMGDGIRFVTHLGVDDSGVARTIDAISGLLELS